MLLISTIHNVRTYALSRRLDNVLEEIKQECPESVKLIKSKENTYERKLKQIYSRHHFDVNRTYNLLKENFGPGLSKSLIAPVSN